MISAALQEIREERLRKRKLLEEAQMPPYPSSANKTHSVREVLESFDDLVTQDAILSLSGRILTIRGQGAIIFFTFTDGTAPFQGMLKKNESDEALFDLFRNAIDTGDFVELTGSLITTKKGEKSIRVSDWRILAKSLLPLPDKWHGIQDENLRLRKRYLEFLSNTELREIFERKAKFWDVTRKFMKQNGFLEVETPTLEHTTGGAEARPFKTKHNDFDIDVYLRISVGELWQKRLMAAGFPKTFEIGRVYRNEGTSPEHLQEFTNMEFYWAYADYRDGMRFVEKFYTTLAKEVFGTTNFSSRGHEFDLEKAWDRIQYSGEIIKQTGIDIASASNEDMQKRLEELGVEHKEGGRERLIDTLWKHCRKNISGPAFVIDIPKIIAPLAKSKKDDPNMSEMFHPIIAGTEVGRGYSELNDPLDQRLRFEEQQKLRDDGDLEAMMPDWEFVEMLEHGMPPACGFGFGDRLFAIFLGKPLRETVLFPLVKPLKE